jgi:hypothetical protein
LNQNRNNNRRRGRGNNRGGPGGGNQGNRIDSRARGNAPQMLEKYRKMAHDASLNGDRVQTEYFLQFADHYFRVVADSRAQRDDQRPRNERDPQQDYDYEEGEELGEAGGPPPSYQTRRERAAEEQAREGEPALEGERADEPEAEANPFVREDETRRPRQRNRGHNANGAAPRDNGTPPAEEAGFDASVLPPAIARDPDEAPRPRTRGRRPPRDDNGDGEAFEAVG